MLFLDNNKFECLSQGFRLKEFDNETHEVIFEDTVETAEVKCPICGEPVHIHGSNVIRLKDMPFYVENCLTLVFNAHRYKCTNCSHTFTRENKFKYPNTFITHRAAKWIKLLLRLNLSIKQIQEITGIHWGTIKKIAIEEMEKMISERYKELESRNYKPKRLAVDEFSIRRGHNYATVVIDLDTGDVIWVGEGRSKANFEWFFEETDPEYLSDVVAFAMDMNASYNNLVEKYLPNAQIVYDRYHMQAQFGRDVLGVVRLNEARAHKAAADEQLRKKYETGDKKAKINFEINAKAEKALYSRLKKARWPLLMNSVNLSDSRKEKLNEILKDHKDLATCYAMKEEMISLYELTDAAKAEEGWKRWFEAAKSSDIPALKKFAEQKEKRIPGLVSHATHQISTGKLEGFNNKIKVAKRIAYGYRDFDYFFTLIKFISLPEVKKRIRFCS